MLSQSVKYGLRAMVCLANHYPFTTTGSQLVEATNAPKAYLPKVMVELNRCGLTRGQRGKNGGFNLLASPENIRLLDIVNALSTSSPFERIRETCPVGGGQFALLDEHLANTNQMVEEKLRNTSLQDILSKAVVSH